MINKTLKNRYFKDLEKLKKFNKYYYDKNEPKVSDAEYDKLKQNILKFEKDYPTIKKNNSPSKNVGYKPSKNFKKKKHRERMLSLSNIFNKEDLINFEKKN